MHGLVDLVELLAVSAGPSDCAHDHDLNEEALGAFLLLLDVLLGEGLDRELLSRRLSRGQVNLGS